MIANCVRKSKAQYNSLHVNRISAAAKTAYVVRATIASAIRVEAESEKRETES